VAAPAQAAQLVTWTTTSRHVDPSKVRFNAPPPGAPARPNALRVNVLLPDGYDGERRFPVLYLLHPREGAYDSWANAEQGDVMHVAKDFPGIIVMPEGALGWYANWWRGGRRGDPGWERYHLDELIPLVEERLRILPGRRWHAIAGPSMGGEGAIFYAAQRPGYFGSAASFSGLLAIQRLEWSTGFGAVEGQPIFGDPTRQEFYWTGHNPAALTGNLRATRLYVTVGDGMPQTAKDGNPVAQVGELNSLAHAQDFVAAARRSGVEVKYVPRPGVHDWPYWRRHLAAAIEWGFFEAGPERSSSWSYATVAQTGDAWGLRFRFVEPPEELERFTLSGPRWLAAAGSGTVSIDTPDGCRLTAELPFERSLPSDDEAPVSIISSGRSVLRRARLTVRGKATDRGCGDIRPVAHVELAVFRRQGGGKCRNLLRSGRLGRRMSCRRPLFLSTRGTSRWRFKAKGRLPSGAYVLRSRAVDRAGNVEPRPSASARNRLIVRLG
jgi:S-formylglutathione hydrolase FrmB